MPARNVECKCEYNFTCGYCMRNAKPYFFTLSSGERIYESSVQRAPKDICSRPGCGHTKDEHEEGSGPCNVRSQSEHCICYQFKEAL